MMRGNTHTLDQSCQRMLFDAGILLPQVREDIGDRLSAFRRERRVAVFKRLHSVVTCTTRSQKNNGRGEVLATESFDQVNRMN